MAISRKVFVAVGLPEPLNTSERATVACESNTYTRILLNAVVPLLAFAVIDDIASSEPFTNSRKLTVFAPWVFASVPYEIA